MVGWPERTWFHYFICSVFIETFLANFERAINLAFFLPSYSFSLCFSYALLGNGLSIAVVAPLLEYLFADSWWSFKYTHHYYYPNLPGRGNIMLPFFIRRVKKPKWITHHRYDFWNLMVNAWKPLFPTLSLTYIKCLTGELL